MHIEEIKSLIFKGHFNEAQAQIDKAFEQGAPSLNICDLYDLQAQIKLRQDNIEYCDSLIEKLKKEGEKDNNVFLLVDGRILLAETSWRTSQYEQMREAIEEGEENLMYADPSETNNYHARYIKLKRLKGVYMRFTGELDLAQEYFEEAFNHAVKMNMVDEIAALYNALGVIHQEKGEYNHAIEYLKQAVRLMFSRGDEYQGSIFEGNLAAVYALLGEIDLALQHYSNVVSYGSKHNSKRIIAHSFLNIGRIYEKLTEFDASLHHFVESYRLYREQKSIFYATEALFHIIQVLFHNNQTDQVEYYVESMMKLKEKSEENKLIKLYFDTSQALIKKHSERLFTRAMAQQEFKKIIFQEMRNFYILQSALFSWTELILWEIRLTGNEEALDELLRVIDELTELSAASSSYEFQIELLQLRSKLAMLELDFVRARSILDDALALARSKGLKLAERKISAAYDEFLAKLDQVKNPDLAEKNILDRMESLEFEAFLAEMVHNKIRPMEKEDPVLFFIFGEHGSLLFSEKFEKSEVNDEILGKIISAISSFIDNTIISSRKDSNERMKFGDYFILTQRFTSEHITFSYVFKAEETYFAQNKFDKLVNAYRKYGFDSSEIEGEVWKEHIDELVKSIIHDQH